MKMKIITLSLLLGVFCGVTTGQAEETSVPEEPGKWEKAGQEIEDAAHAVKDATVDTSKKVWGTTKEESKEAWDTTKKKSKELWDEGRAKLHEVTAPQDEAPAPESSDPESTADEPVAPEGDQ